MIKNIIIRLFLLLILIGGISLIYKSPLERLQYAIRSDDSTHVSWIIKWHPELLNYVDSTYIFNTPLISAVAIRKKKAVMALLHSGANPRVESCGWSPIESAVLLGNNEDLTNYDQSYVELLLKHGADPNHLYCIPETIPGISYTHNNKSPLMLSVNRGMEKMLSLLNYGADINFKNKYGRTAAIQALTLDAMDAAYELIVNRKADITQPYYCADYTTHEPKLDDPRYPVDILLMQYFEPGSPEYEMKMEIVKVFEENGIDYHSRKNLSNRFFRHTLEYIKERHPDDWEEYVKIY